MKCLICNKKHNNKKYCSHECYHKGRVGKSFVTPKGLKSRSKKLKAYYKSLSETDRIKKNLKIGNSNRKNLTKKQKRFLLELLENKYCKDVNIIGSHVGVSGRLIYNLFKEDTLFKNKHNKVPKFIASDIQKMDLSVFKKFFKDCQTKAWDSVCNKYNISKKKMQSFCKRRGIVFKHKKYGGKETKPEKIIRELLEKEDINFIQEKYITRKFRCDFLLKNSKIIEVNGDYWHANPKIYNLDDLNIMQKNNTSRDIEKRIKYKELGFQLLEIWESDIYKNIDMIKKKIISFNSSN